MMIKAAKFIALAAAGLMATSAIAQEQTTQRVATEADWSVFVEGNPKECFAVSKPKETRNTRNGQAVQVRRGDILLFVFYRPGENVSGQVSFTGGYPFAPNSTVDLKIGSNNFKLFVDGEWAWPENAAEDAKIVAALKRGADVVLTARSSRGTQTQDTFSLIGVTAAVDEAAARCK